MQTASPFWRSASLYLGGIHFLWQAVVSLTQKEVKNMLNENWFLKNRSNEQSKSIFLESVYDFFRDRIRSNPQHSSTITSCGWPGVHVGHHLDLELLNQLHFAFVQLGHRHRGGLVWAGRLWIYITDVYNVFFITADWVYFSERISSLTCFCSSWKKIISSR